MLNQHKLEGLALEVKRLGVDIVAETSGVARSRVSRFIKNQHVVTVRELDKIEEAVTQLK